MTQIRLIQDVLIDGEHQNAGDSVAVENRMAQLLIGIGKAVMLDSVPVIETADIAPVLEKAVVRKKR